MKKWMKRIISIALIAVMTLGLATAALADDEDDESTGHAHFLFENVEEPQPDLYVTKTVTEAIPGYTAPDVEFTFTLKWDQDGDGVLEFADSVSYFLYDESGTQIKDPDTSDGSYKTSQYGQFTLKAGQYVRFEWAQEVDYEITEIPVENFTQTEPAGGEPATGTVDAKGTIVEFENTYTPPPNPDGEGEGATTQLAIRKDIAWPDGYEMPDLSDVNFTFQVSIDGSFYANEAYTIYDASMTTQEGTGRTDDQGQLTLTGGQLALFEDVEVGVDYEVKELATDGWRIIGNSSYAGATTTPIIYTYFTNAYAAFSVEKERTDGITGSDGGTFTFKLTDGNGNAMSGVTYYLYDADGKLVTEDSDMSDNAAHTTGADGTFTFEAGQKVLFVGFDDGTIYKVEEINEAGDFQVSPADGYTGTVSGASVAEYEFTNEELSDITIQKYGKSSDKEDLLLGGAEFTIYKLKEGGSRDEDSDWEPYPDKDSATKITSREEDSLGTLTFANLPAGTYKIVETKTPAGYIACGEPIIVTLPYTLTDAQVNSEKIDTDNNDFTGRYNSETGLYYFYDLTYSVDNEAVLVMPNTGGKAWIIIVIAICGGAAALGSVYTYRRRHNGKEKGRA